VVLFGTRAEAENDLPRSKMISIGNSLVRLKID
jgi:hypothetical protein